MTRKRPGALTPPLLAAANRDRILALVLSTRFAGIRSAEIVAQTGICNSTVWLHLKTLLDAKLIEKSSKTGNGVKWGAPGIYAAFSAQRARHEAQRKRREHKRAEQARKDADDSSTRLDATVAHRVPVSIWHAAQQAAV